MSFYMRHEEIADLDRLAAERGVKRNALVRQICEAAVKRNR